MKDASTILDLDPTDDLSPVVRAFELTRSCALVSPPFSLGQVKKSPGTWVVRDDHLLVVAVCEQCDGKTNFARAVMICNALNFHAALSAQFRASQEKAVGN